MEEAARIERRSIQRVSVNFPVTVTCNEKQIQSQARALSMFGMLVAVADKELKGKNVEVAWQLDKKEPAISLTGTVAYTTRDAIGIRFKALSTGQYSTLNAYVLAHSA